MKKANVLFADAKAKYDEAAVILAADDGDFAKADDLMAEATELEERAKKLKVAEGFSFEDEPKAPATEVTKKGVKELQSELEKSFHPAMVEALMKMLGDSSIDLGEFKSFDETQVSGQAQTFGNFLKAVRFGDEDTLKAFGSKKDKEVKDLLGQSGVSGGYLVPAQQLSELLRVDEGDAVVRPYARKMPMASRSLTIPKLEQDGTPAEYWKLDYFGGVLSYWTEEGAAKTETEPEFGQMELIAHKLAGHTQASDELLADSAIGLDALLSDLFRGAIVMREDFAFLRGTGVGMPLGILNSPVLLTQARNAADTVAFVDIANMLGQFLPSSYGNAVWVVSLLALPQLLQMQDGAGNNVFIPNATGGVVQTIPGTLLGRPVIVSEKVPNLGSTGDVLLADFSYYIIGDRQATTIQASEHYAFINDLTTWRFVHRVDGQPWLDAPIYIDTTNKVSPFVALAA